MKVIDNFDGEFAFLSNFFPSVIKYEGITYPTVEHAFQAAKSFDPTDRLLIACAETPGKAKKMGRNVNLRADWDEVKYNVMFELVLQKFKYNPVLALKLLDTGDATLIEGNWWGDKIWGVCNGEGTNWLGQILMDVRKIIREETKA